MRRASLVTPLIFLLISSLSGAHAQQVHFCEFTVISGGPLEGHLQKLITEAIVFIDPSATIRFDPFQFKVKGRATPEEILAALIDLPATFAAAHDPLSGFPIRTSEMTDAEYDLLKQQWIGQHPDLYEQMQHTDR